VGEVATEWLLDCESSPKQGSSNLSHGERQCRLLHTYQLDTGTFTTGEALNMT